MRLSPQYIWQPVALQALLVQVSLKSASVVTDVFLLNQPIIWVETRHHGNQQKCKMCLFLLYPLTSNYVICLIEIIII